MSSFFLILQETRAHKTQQNTDKASEHNGCNVFLAYQQVVSNLSYILYPLLILIPHYMQQITFSPPPLPPTEYAPPPTRLAIRKSTTVSPLTDDESCAPPARGAHGPLPPPFTNPVAVLGKKGLPLWILAPIWNSPRKRRLLLNAAIKA